jgi:hypothetical protein
MMKIEVNLSSEYGIMFLYDSKAKPTFPVEAGKNPVMWTSTCLAFSVLIYVDGDAKIILCEAPNEQTCKEYFTGEIECPSKSISLYDHNGFPFASIPLRDGFARVSLRMSEETNPDIVECVIENMETF